MQVFKTERERVREGLLEETVFRLKPGLRGTKRMKSIPGNLEMLHKYSCLVLTLVQLKSSQRADILQTRGGKVQG